MAVERAAIAVATTLHVFVQNAPINSWALDSKASWFLGHAPLLLRRKLMFKKHIAQNYAR